MAQKGSADQSCRVEKGNRNERLAGYCTLRVNIYQTLVSGLLCLYLDKFIMSHMYSIECARRENMNIRLISALCLLLVLPNVVLAADHIKTVFIEGDVKFEAHPDRKGAYIYIKPGINLAQFDRIAINAIEVFMHPDSPYKGVQPDDFKAITNTLRQVLVDNLEPTYPVVDKLGPDTLVLKMAITGVKLKEKKRGLLGYTPIGLAVSAGQDKVSSRVTLIDAAIEAEFYDAQSGERVAARVDETVDNEDAKSWSGMKLILDDYGKRIKAALDNAHAK